MQVRPLRATGIATIGNKSTLAYRKLFFGKINFNGPAFFFFLFGPYIFFEGREKIIQVSIKGGKPVGMPDDNKAAEAGCADSDMGDITLGGSIYRVVFFGFRADIESHMPVIGPKLAEISGELNGYPHWITEIVPGIRRSLGF